MRILITGAGGFAGSHLADYLLAQDQHEIWGVNLIPNHPHYLDERVHLVVANLCSPEETHTLLNDIKPNRIYHLAGQASPAKSWDDPWDTIENNIRAQLNIFQSCVKLNFKETRVLAVGSSDEYGRLELSELPAREDSPLRADSPYGVSKIAQDFMGQSYFLSHRLPVVRVRPFNHIGPRQSPIFVAPNFARQIVAIERGDAEAVIHVGNLKAERDFTDVRDTVRGYVAALEYGELGEVYNIASGVVRPISEVLDGLLLCADRFIRVEVDPSRFRPTDIERQHGDASKLSKHTAWQPTIPFEQSLKDLLDYERDNFK